MTWRPTLSWLVVKDVALTGTAIWVIVSQVLSPQPHEVLLVAALALTAVNGGTHAATLMAGRTGGGHSPPLGSPERLPSPPSSPPGATREHS